MQEKILEAFLYNNTLKFSEIEKKLSVRSNKLSYHLKNLIKQGILKKEHDTYILTKSAQPSIPYVSKKSPVMSVILVAIEDPKHKNNIFLIEREKRPFKDKYGLPGGRLQLGESIHSATTRIAQKWHVNATFKKVHAVNLEHVIQDDKTMHSFLLILVSATTQDTIQYTDIKEQKHNIIESDYTLLTKHLKGEVQVEELITQA